MSKSRDFEELLSQLIRTVSTELGFFDDAQQAGSGAGVPVDDLLGEVDDRVARMVSIFNSVNEFIVSSDPLETAALREYVVDHLPRFLVGYQSIRFPQIKETGTSQFPTKADLTKFPELINDTGLFVPVSTCLRLIAVCLTDDRSKQRLIDCGNVKSIVSHMVDDPLNPFQRESAIFVVNVFTREYPPAQAAVSSVMRPPSVS